MPGMLSGLFHGTYSVTRWSGPRRPLHPAGDRAVLGTRPDEPLLSRRRGWRLQSGQRLNASRGTPPLRQVHAMCT
jgi:hypothetical protein